MTLISVQIGLGWHPSGIPDGIAIFNIVVVSIAVERNIVITVSRQTKKLCIFIEAIATAGIGDQRKEILRTQIVDPWEWCLRRGNNIFFVRIIEISKFHVCILHIKLFTCDIVDESGKKHLVE